MKGCQRVGCQTYTWQMLGEDWTGTPDDVLDAVSTAGYDGVEFSNVMIGHYLQTPDRFATAVRKRNLVCAAFAYATTGFTTAERFEEDLAGAQRALEFCSVLGIPLCLGGAASPSRDGYDLKFEQAVRFYDAVTEHGVRMGVMVCVHPHSHHGSLIESAEEYDRILSITAGSGLMFNPDAGHIVRGGQNLMDCMRRHRDRIAHVHIKDVDENGNWQPLGQGIIEWQPLFDFLKETHYKGWIVAEEESGAARKNPLAAISRNREFLKSIEIWEKVHE